MDETQFSGGEDEDDANIEYNFFPDVFAACGHAAKRLPAVVSGFSFKDASTMFNHHTKELEEQITATIDVKIGPHEEFGVTFWAPYPGEAGEFKAIVTYNIYVAPSQSELGGLLEDSSDDDEKDEKCPPDTEPRFAGTLIVFAERDGSYRGGHLLTTPEGRYSDTWLRTTLEEFKKNPREARYIQAPPPPKQRSSDLEGSGPSKAKKAKVTPGVTTLAADKENHPPSTDIATSLPPAVAGQALPAPHVQREEQSLPLTQLVGSQLVPSSPAQEALKSVFSKTTAFSAFLRGAMGSA